MLKCNFSNLEIKIALIKLFKNCQLNSVVLQPLKGKMTRHIMLFFVEWKEKKFSLQRDEENNPNISVNGDLRDGITSVETIIFTPE